MFKDHLLPHFIFDTHIFLNKNHTKNNFFHFNQVEMEKQTDVLKNILSHLNAKTDEVVCWFTVDHGCDKKKTRHIEKHLEQLIERLLNSCDVIVNLVPFEKNDTLQPILAQVERLLLTLTKRYPIEHFGHVAGAGNPLLSQALLIESLKEIPDRYISLYWNGAAVETVHYDIPKKPQQWLSLFKTFILDYDYCGALELLKDLSDESEEKQLIEFLLESQIKRMNFAFDEAEGYIKQALIMLPENETLLQSLRILNRTREVDSKTKDLECISELFRQIDIFIETDDITSFLVRFYRVREAVLQYLYNYTRVNEGAVKSSQKRSTIYQLVEELEELYDSREIDGHYGAYFFMKSQNTHNILQFRNQSFIGHSRKYIDTKSLWRSFVGFSPTTSLKAKRRFQMDIDLLLRDLGVHEDDNYASINNLILQRSERLLDVEVHDGKNTTAAV